MPARRNPVATSGQTVGTVDKPGTWVAWRFVIPQYFAGVVEVTFYVGKVTVEQCHHLEALAALDGDVQVKVFVTESVGESESVLRLEVAENLAVVGIDLLVAIHIFKFEVTHFGGVARLGRVVQIRLIFVNADHVVNEVRGNRFSNLSDEVSVSCTTRLDDWCTGWAQLGYLIFVGRVVDVAINGEIIGSEWCLNP